MQNPMQARKRCLHTQPLPRAFQLSIPLAACIMSAAEEMKLPKAAEVEEIAGHGVKAVVDGRTVCAGNLKLMHKIGAKPVERDASGTVIYTAVDGKYMGCIEIADTPKEGAKKAVEELNNDWASGL